MVCVRKPNSLAFRGGVRKPGRPSGRDRWAPVGFGLRTKTEFIGFQGRRTQTRAPLRPGSMGAGRLWFAYENRIHWLSRQAYANQGVPLAGFKGSRPGSVRARKPNSLAFTGGKREPERLTRQIKGRPSKTKEL